MSGKIFVAYSGTPDANEELAVVLHEQIDCLMSTITYIIPDPEQDAGRGLSERTLEVFDKCDVFLPIVSNTGRSESSNLNQELGFAAKKDEEMADEWIVPFVDNVETYLGLLDIPDVSSKISANSDDFNEVDRDTVFSVIKTVGERLDPNKKWVIVKNCEKCPRQISTNPTTFERMERMAGQSHLTSKCDCGTEYNVNPITFEKELVREYEEPGIDLDDGGLAS